MPVISHVIELGHEMDESASQVNFKDVSEQLWMKDDKHVKPSFPSDM